jgi:hypothetical protein
MTILLLLLSSLLPQQGVALSRSKASFVFFLGLIFLLRCRCQFFSLSSAVASSKGSVFSLSQTVIRLWQEKLVVFLSHRIKGLKYLWFKSLFHSVHQVFGEMSVMIYTAP